jgi:hypothetical protein
MQAMLIEQQALISSVYLGPCDKRIQKVGINLKAVAWRGGGRGATAPGIKILKTKKKKAYI